MAGKRLHISKKSVKTVVLIISFKPEKSDNDGITIIASFTATP